MKKLIQTRLHNPPLSRGNCFPAVIACFLDLDSPEDVIQVQEIYDKEGIDWRDELDNWLINRGWEMGSLRNHLQTDEYYLVSGVSPRNPNINHVCIYQKGKLFHDPHPDQTGILTEDYFEYLEKISKTCFKCKKMKSLKDYYKHSQMGDGHLNKCKKCTILDSKLTAERKTSTPEGLEKERERHRDKYHRLDYKDKHKPTPEKKKEIMDRYNNKYPEKRKAKIISQRLVPLVKGNELHHWNYTIEFAKDVIEMSSSEHAKAHRFIVYNPLQFIYETPHGTILDTKEKHIEHLELNGVIIHEKNLHNKVRNM